MKLIKELFYPTPVYYIDLDGADQLNQFLLTRIYAWRDRDQTGITRSNAKMVGSWHSPTTMNRLAEYELFVKKVNQIIVGAFTDQLYHPGTQAVCQNM